MKFGLKTDYRTSPPKVFKRGKKGIYHWRQRINGRDVRRSLHTTNKREAERMAYQIWYSQQNQSLKDILEMPAIPISQAWDMHIRSERFRLLADSSMRTREHNFQRFHKWCEERGIEFINDISRENIQAYFNNHKCANKTFNNILNDLRQVFKQFFDSQNIENPFERIDQKSTTRGEGASQDYREFTDTELDQIFKLLSESKLPNKEEWIIACHIALNTGLRYKDIAFLQWSHVTQKQFIELKPHKTSNQKKSVIIPLSDRLKIILGKIPKKSFYLLPGLARSYTAKSTRPFMRLLHRNGFSGKVGFHSFRSTFVTWAKKAGIDSETLRGAVGHTTIAMTEHYNKNAATMDVSFLDSKKYGTI